MARTEPSVRVAPVTVGIASDGTRDQVVGFPVVSRPDVSVQYWQEVALDLEIDTSERGIEAAAHDLDCLAQHLHTGEKGDAAASRQVRQSASFGLVGEQQAVAGEELDVADHRKACVEMPDDGWIGPVEGRGHSVGAPVSHRCHVKALVGQPRPVDRSQSAGWLDRHQPLDHAGQESLVLDDLQPGGVHLPDRPPGEVFTGAADAPELNGPLQPADRGE